MTENQQVYLKPNVLPEALFNGWYTNAYLMSPLTAAFNIKRRHLTILESYLENPEVHIQAVKRPELRGGPFIDYPKERYDELNKLYQDTLQSQQKMIALADAVVDLNEMLNSYAKGYSLESLYHKIPDLLKGYVELTYDLNNNVSFRLFESMLYKAYYDESCQSIALQLIDADDSRSFVLSTPRLKEKGIINLNIPYRSEQLSELFEMTHIAKSYDYIKKRLNISEQDESVFRTFFTHEKPMPYNKYDGSGIRSRYFGHASILLETNSKSLLVDPVISYEYDTDLYRYTFNDLPEKIDYLLITHNHQDHVNIETLIQLRHRVKNVIVPRCALGSLQDPSLKLMFSQLGFPNIIELSELEEIKLDDTVITGLPFYGEHSDLDIRSKLCYHIQFGNELTVLLASDSCNIEPKAYQNVKSYLSDVDVMYLGMECDGAPLSWVYGQYLLQDLDRERDQSRRLAGSNFTQALELVNCFNPSSLFVYAMGMEPWLEYISSVKYTDESRPIKESNKLINRCKEMGVKAERLFGEKTIEYDQDNVSQVFI
jgi:L-ascorbate metabolism protein UlaG (beta-lactamase superfamily)